MHLMPASFCQYTQGEEETRIENERDERDDKKVRAAGEENQ